MGKMGKIVLVFMEYTACLHNNVSSSFTEWGNVKCLREMFNDDNNMIIMITLFSNLVPKIYWRVSECSNTSILRKGNLLEKKKMKKIK